MFSQNCNTIVVKIILQWEKEIYKYTHIPVDISQ